MSRKVNWGVLVAQFLSARLLLHHQNYMLEIEQFGRCILDGEKPLVGMEETLRNARVLDMAFRDSRA